MLGRYPSVSLQQVSPLGTLVTHPRLIEPGALHQATGGSVLLDAFKLLMQPFSWKGLKRVLARRFKRCRAAKKPRKETP